MHAVCKYCFINSNRRRSGNDSSGMPMRGLCGFTQPSPQVWACPRGLERYRSCTASIKSLIARNGGKAQSKYPTTRIHPRILGYYIPPHRPVSLPPPQPSGPTETFKPTIRAESRMSIKLHNSHFAVHSPPLRVG